MASQRMDFAISAVRAAARQVRKFDMHRGDIKVTYKSPGDPVTNADLASEEVILEMTAERYPEEGVLSEERGLTGSKDRCWVLDPIDGTTNFLHGLPDFAISLAWCRGGKPELGVVYDICRDEIYSAEQGRGAFCDQRRIKVSTNRSMQYALIGSTGSAGPKTWRWDLLAEASRRSSGFRRRGSSTLDFAHTARGLLDASFGANLHYWDYAAGGVILAEAGGVFTDLEGNSEVAFGKRLGLCIFGSRRIAGNLRRMAVEFHDSKDRD